jgi:Tol biopolymer transport system component
LTQIFISQVRDDRPTEQAEQIAATDGKNWDVLPEFSPDGKRIYFLSQRDGFRCLWTQPLDAATKKPVGAPVPVYHLHSARRTPMTVRQGQVSISLARDKIVFTMEERTGNIWLAELEAR